MLQDGTVQSIGTRLRMARHLRGQTQQEAAVTMGVSLIAVSMWENHRRRPRGLYEDRVEKYIRDAIRAARRHQREGDRTDEPPSIP